MIFPILYFFNIRRSNLKDPFVKMSHPYYSRDEDGPELAFRDHNRYTYDDDGPTPSEIAEDAHDRREMRAESKAISAYENALKTAAENRDKSLLEAESLPYKSAREDAVVNAYSKYISAFDEARNALYKSGYDDYLYQDRPRRDEEDDYDSESD